MFINTLIYKLCRYTVWNQYWRLCFLFGFFFFFDIQKGPATRSKSNNCLTRPNEGSQSGHIPKKKQLAKTTKVKAVPLDAVHQGDIILVKMRGYCEWPGRVENVNGNAIQIKFFGDNTTCTTTIKNTFSFKDSADVVLDYLRGRKSPLYAKAIEEAEMLLNIPVSQSILRKI